MSSIANKRIVVIGGNGHLGSAAVEAASAGGADVFILSRSAKNRDGATSIQGSITDPASLRTALEGAAGIVISVESGDSREEMQAVYVEGTGNVLSIAPEGAHIIFMSHIGITDINRMPDYNRAKLEAEALIRASGRPYTIVRPSWVISGSHGVKLEQGDRYTGRRDDIGHADLGAAIVAAFENTEARGKTFELYGGGTQSLDWQEEFAKLTTDG